MGPVGDFLEIIDRRPAGPHIHPIFLVRRSTPPFPPWTESPRSCRKLSRQLDCDLAFTFQEMYLGIFWRMETDQMEGARYRFKLKRIQKVANFGRDIFSVKIEVVWNILYIPFGKLQWKDQESEIGSVGTFTVTSSRDFVPEDQLMDWTGLPKGSPRCPTCGNFFRWMESLQIWFDVMEPHWIYLHPWNINGWNPKITQLKSGKSFEPNLHGFGFQNVIF